MQKTRLQWLVSQAKWHHKRHQETKKRWHRSQQFFYQREAVRLMLFNSLSKRRVEVCQQIKANNSLLHRIMAIDTAPQTMV